MSQSTAPLEPNTVYHLFTHAVHDNNLFLKDQNYDFFLKRWNELSKPFFTTYAYCLMPNHLHLCVQTTSEANIPLEIVPPNFFSRKVGNVLSSYAQSLNHQIKRKGTLYRSRFKRIKVLDETYLRNLICYLHYNPFHHFGSDDCASYPFSSLEGYLSPSSIASKQKIEIILPKAVKNVLSIFGDLEGFQAFHEQYLLDKQFRYAIETKMAEYDKEFIRTLL